MSVKQLMQGTLTMSMTVRIESEYLRRRNLMLQLIDACEEAHPASTCLLKGIVLQLDWQWQSGRWNPRQTGGSDWWQLANYTLTAWVAEAAVEAGVVKYESPGSADPKVLAMPQRIATAWKKYFSRIADSRTAGSEISQGELTRLYWLAHDACLDEIASRFSDDLDRLPPEEKRFASSWVTLVRILARLRFNPGIKAVTRLQKLLPRVILDDSGWASSTVFSRFFLRSLAWGHRLIGLMGTSPAVAAS